MKKNRILVIAALCAVLGCGLMLFSGGGVFNAFAVGQSSVTVRSDLAAQIVGEVNAERAAHGLSVLRVDAELNRAAQVRAQELLRKFSHTRPDGSKWSTVSSAAYAENIARGHRTPEKVMAAWLSSRTGHRENLLRPGYGSIGVCALSCDGVMYWVQLFGK